MFEECKYLYLLWNHFYLRGSMGLWVGKNFLAHGDVISLINNWDDFNEYETNDCTCKQVPGDVNSWASQEHWSPTNNDNSKVLICCKLVHFGFVCTGMNTEIS